GAWQRMATGVAPFHPPHLPGAEHDDLDRCRRPSAAEPAGHAATVLSSIAQLVQGITQGVQGVAEGVQGVAGAVGGAAGAVGGAVGAVGGAVGAVSDVATSVLSLAQGPQQDPTAGMSQVPTME
ncbi:hypothetical protein, partial [Corallococcus sp. AB018]|uniref:hypothetical protein n=1 Tax=Corallococcus sp. AB018 TaxID=2316715 RepID=UPI001F4425E4